MMHSVHAKLAVVLAERVMRFPSPLGGEKGRVRGEPRRKVRVRFMTKDPSVFGLRIFPEIRHLDFGFQIDQFGVTTMLSIYARMSCGEKP